MKLIRRLLELILVSLALCALLGNGDPMSCSDVAVQWMITNQKYILLLLGAVGACYYLCPTNSDHFSLNKEKEDAYWNYYVNTMGQLHSQNDPAEITNTMCGLDHKLNENNQEYMQWALDRNLMDSHRDLMSYAREKVKYYPEKLLPTCKMIEPRPIDYNSSSWWTSVRSA